MKTLRQDEALSLLTHEIDKLVRQYRPRARFRFCLRCGTRFPMTNGARRVTDQKVWCSAACGRQAHYLHFKVRIIRKGETP